MVDPERNGVFVFIEAFPHPLTRYARGPMLTDAIWLRRRWKRARAGKKLRDVLRNTFVQEMTAEVDFETIHSGSDVVAKSQGGWVGLIGKMQ